MKEPKPGDPWAYIAHKGSLLGGITVADEDAGEFVADFIKRGYAIMTVYGRDEYNAAISKMEFPRRDKQSPHDQTDAS